MASFDFIYVTADQGQEHAFLESLKPHVARFYGDYALRTRRGSGWVQIQSLGTYEQDLELERTDEAEPAEVHQCRELSRSLGVDVILVSAVTSVDAVEFTRWRGGEIARHFLYSPEDKRFESGWGEEEGPPEPWEKPYTEGGSVDAVDIGASLGLPGLEKAYLGGAGVFDLEATVVGQRIAVPATIKKAGQDRKGKNLPSARRFLVLAVSGLVALMWISIVYRRWRASSSK